MAWLVLSSAMLSSAQADETMRNAGAGEIAPDDDDEEATSWHEKTNSVTEAARETWAGAEVTRRVLSFYNGSTYAPFGNLRQDGLRLRAVSALSAYRYAGLRFDPSVMDARSVRFHGQSRTVDVLAGYQWSAGALTAKLFAGVALAGFAIAPFDPETSIQGQGRGAKAALELWYNVSATQWAALDITAVTLHRTYAHRLRLGQRVHDLAAVGVEASAFGHSEGDTRRFGAFVRYDDGRHEVSFSAGGSFARGDAAAAYATVQWLYRY